MRTRATYTVAVLGILAAVALVMWACGGPGPTPAPRVIVAVPTLSSGYYHPAAIEDYTGAGYNIPGISLSAHVNVVWNKINPGNGVYDWDGSSGLLDGLDDYLAVVAGQTITISGGAVISRPVWVTIPSFWIQGTGGNCANYVPNWVKAVAPDYVIAGQSVPAMDDSDFQAAYRNLILALGNHIQNDLSAAQRAQIAGFFIAAGYDNENSIEGDYCGVTMAATNVEDLITQSEYWAFLSGAVGAFHDALPGYPVFTLNANYSWAVHNCQLLTLLESYTPRHIGWGFNGMNPDVPGWIMRPPSQVGCGSLEVVQRTLDVLPVKMEPVSASADYQTMYWSWLLALGGFRADTVHLQDPWFDDGGASQLAHYADDYGFPIPFWDFILRQLGDTPGTTQDAWLAFHDTEYPRSAPGFNDYRCYDTQGNVYCHGYEGNIGRWMAVSAGDVTPRCSVYRMPDCQDDGLPTHTGTAPNGSSTNPFSRHAGRLDDTTTTLVVSDTIGFYGDQLSDARLRIAWLGNGTGTITATFASEIDAAGIAEITRVNDGAWHWSDLVLADFYVGNVLPSGGVLDLTYSGTAPTLHMIWIDLSGMEPGPGVTPTPTPTHTPTPVPTHTPTPTPWAGSLAISEYGTEETHDWYPDGRADTGDGYVEIYNGVGGTIAVTDYTLQIVGGDGITTTYTFNATLPAARYYVLWAADMNLTLPATGTISLLNDLEIPVATAVIVSTPSPGQSMQYCGAAWVSQLGSPGEPCGYWTAVPTPTGMP